MKHVINAWKTLVSWWTIVNKKNQEYTNAFMTTVNNIYHKAMA